MRLSCIIVDGEAGTRRILEEYISRLDNLELRAEFSNAADALHFLKQNKADILFLDMDMPQVAGFQLLDAALRPAIVFATARSGQVLPAGENGAMDYLCKPIRFEHFVNVIEKVSKYCAPEQTSSLPLQIELKVNGSMRALNTRDIYYVQSLGNYLKIYYKEGTLIVLMSMNGLTAKLGRNIFVRIHKSYLVNLARISSAGNDAVFINKTYLPVGKTFKKHFLERLKVIHRNPG